MQTLKLPARALAPAILALTVGGCANLGTQGEPVLPKTAKYPKDQAVALLLPTSAEGRLGAAVDAIEAGYSAALMRDPQFSRKPITQDTGSDARAAYEKVAKTAQPPLIIGPLLKNDVNAVAEARTASSPAMLALNEANQSRAGMYQFALAPEDEAKTAARLINGLRDAGGRPLSTAIVYPSDDPWGERMRSAFVGALDEGPSAEVAYTSGQPGNLGAKIEAADIVFMVARPKEAAGVYTALGGSTAGVPVIASSHAADNKSDAADKAGLFYVDVPWLVNQDMAREYIARSPDKPKSDHTKGELGRLYAMGIDAYYLGALVANGGSGAGTPLQLPAGMTGDLSFTNTGRMMSRRLSLGRIGASGVTGPATTEDLAAAVKAADTAKAAEASASAANARRIQG
jgi:outer membrane PBP1 activator LpoA protein